MATRAVLLDIAGVLYTGETPIAGARQAFARLTASGMPVRLVTNTTRSPRRVVLERLRRMGFEVADDQLFTAPDAARAYLRSRGLTILPLVHRALEEDLEGLIGPEPNAVLVADAGDRFSYGMLNAAFRLLMDGAPLLAVAASRYFREESGLSLDAGPFVKALEYAAGLEATLLGKPAVAFYETVLSDVGCAAAEALMVGDDVEADVNGAIDAGLSALLVRTGKYRPEDDARLRPGAEVVADIGAAVERILTER